MELVENIQQNGADVEFYENGYLIFYEIVCNLIETWNEIGYGTELDIQGELGLEEDE